MILPGITTDDETKEVLNSPEAIYTGIMPHPEKEHFYILFFADKDKKTLSHRVADAAMLMRHCHSILCMVDQLSVGDMSDLLKLNLTKGAPN